MRYIFLCANVSGIMVKKNHNIEGYPTKQAAGKVGVSAGRIRQLVTGDDPIDHEYVLGRLIITPKGIKQAKARNTKIGRKPKAPATNGDSDAR